VESEQSSTEEGENGSKKKMVKKANKTFLSNYKDSLSVNNAESKKRLLNLKYYGFGEDKRELNLLKKIKDNYKLLNHPEKLDFFPEVNLNQNQAEGSKDKLQGLNFTKELSVLLGKRMNSGQGITVEESKQLKTEKKMAKTLNRILLSYSVVFNTETKDVLANLFSSEIDGCLDSLTKRFV
jgi:hypothetical protein